MGTQQTLCDNQKLCHLKWRRCHRVHQRNQWILRLKREWNKQRGTVTQKPSGCTFRLHTHASPGCPLKYKAWLNHDSTVTGTHKLFNYTRNFVKSTFTHSFHSQYRTPYCTVQTEYWTATCRNYSLGHNHKQPGMCLGWHPASSARIEPSGPQVLLGHLKSCTEVYILIHNWYSNKPKKEFTSLPLKKHTPSASPDALESSTSCPASLLGPHLRNRTVKGT